MAENSSIAAFAKKLDLAIFATMQDDVAETVRETMSRFLESYDYVKSRGPHGMGVRDRRNFDAKVEQAGDVTTLRVTDVAKFQSGVQGSKSLAMVVETGDRAYKMPGPRPFLAPTQKDMNTGAAEKALHDGLKKRGIGV